MLMKQKLQESSKSSKNGKVLLKESFEFVLCVSRDGFKRTLVLVYCKTFDIGLVLDSVFHCGILGNFGIITA